LALLSHSETLEEMVVYKATYQEEGEIYGYDPLAMFLETVVIDGVEQKAI
jgi:hypothetical protein